MRLLVVSVAALLVLVGCGRAGSPPEQGEEEPAPGGGAGQSSASATAAAPETHGVGETAETGPLRVTLNGVRDYSFETYTTPGSASPSSAGTTGGEKTYPGHYYAVVDLTLENRAQAPVDATIDVEYQLRDAQGYSFETEPLTEQKPPPEGQIPPGGKVAGEIAFDLGTKPAEGPLTLYVSLWSQPDVPPAAFEFEVERSG